MPYKSEIAKIEGTNLDRRVKLTREDKELIKWLSEEEKLVLTNWLRGLE